MTLRRVAVIAILICLVPLLAPTIARHDPADQSNVTKPGYRLSGPSWEHPLGTDLFSRDVLSRVLHGARISIMVASLAIIVAVTVGSLVGLLAGLSGGIVDTMLMRGLDVFLSIPRLFLLLLIFSLWQEMELLGVVLILGLTSWFETSRLVRGEVLSARGREYVTATQALGFGPARVALGHVLPNVAGPIMVSATLGVGQLILLEAGLAFIGIGLPAPNPSLGNMIADGSPFLFRAPLLSFAPGLVIIALVLAFSALGENLRQALDPRTR